MCWGTLGDWAQILAAVGTLVVACFAGIGIRQTRDIAQRQETRRKEESHALATALVVEIHHFAARCALDGVTWGEKLAANQKPAWSEAQKFRPFGAAVYLASVDKLSWLSPKAAHKVVRFYNAVEAVDRQIASLRDSPREPDSGQRISASELHLITARFHQTILPALEALRELAQLVQNYDALVTELAAGDRQYLSAPSVVASVGPEGSKRLETALKTRLVWFQSHPVLSKYAPRDYAP